MYLAKLTRDVEPLVSVIKNEKKIAASILARKMVVHDEIPETVARFKNSAPNVNSRLAAKGYRR